MTLDCSSECNKLQQNPERGFFIGYNNRVPNQFYMSTLANQTGLETLAETIFEEMIKSFKDLTPSEEQIVYDCACDEAIKQTS